MNAAGSRRGHLASAALLAVLVLVVWSNAWHAGFVYDSHFVIEGDPRLAAASADNLRLVFTRDYWWPHAVSGLYRPLTTFSYFLHTWLGGPPRVAWHYRAVNVALHLAVAFSGYLLCCQFGGGRSPALAGAMLFAAHPIAVEAVTNLVGRADLLAALSLVLGLLFWRRGGRLATALALLIATLGVFAKESAVVLLPLALLLDRLHPGQGGARRASATGAWLLLPVAALACARLGVVGTLAPVAASPLDNPIAGAGFWAGRATAVKVLGQALGLLAWPRRLSPDYSFDAIPLVSGGLLASAGLWLGAIALAALGVVVAVGWRRAPAIAFFLLFAALSHLPTANLLTPIGSILAERFLYAPALGLAMALALAVDRWSGTPLRRRLALLLMAASVLALGLTSHRRNRDWRDELSLWRAAVEVVPRSYRAQAALASAIESSGERTPGALDQAIAAWARAGAIAPARPEIEVPLAVARRRRADARGSGVEAADPDYRQAERGLRRALERMGARAAGAEPLAHRAHLELGLLALRRGDPEAAMTGFRSSIPYDPLDPEPRRQLFGPLLESGQQREAAIELWQAALAVGTPLEGLEIETLERLYAGSQDLGCMATPPARCPAAAADRCEAASRLVASIDRARGDDPLGRWQRRREELAREIAACGRANAGGR